MYGWPEPLERVHLEEGRIPKAAKELGAPYGKDKAKNKAPGLRIAESHVEAAGAAGPMALVSPSVEYRDKKIREYEAEQQCVTETQ